MAWILMLSVGAVLAGLFMGARELVPYITARRSGVIKRKGALAMRIRRDEDPDRFARLLANRSRGAATGFGLSVIGVIGLSLCWLALAGFTGPLAIVIFVVYLGFILFAAICLIRGFVTGRMFAFWSLTLFGDATLKQNPTWYWTYAALNVLIVLVGAFTLLRAFSA